MGYTKSVISITHNDLDGAGCQVVLRWKIDDLTNFSISYSKIDETLINLEHTLEYDRNISTVVISDISLKEPQLLRLKKMVEAFPDIHFIMADHHLRSTYIRNLYKQFPKNFTDLYDTTKCSAKILFYYFNIQAPKIKEFIELVDSYDLWKTDRENFQEALIYNEIYESMAHYEFVNGIGYYGGFKDGISRKYQKTRDKIISYKNNIPTNDLIYYNEKIAISHIDRYKSVVQYFLNRPINIIISSNFNFSIRLSNDIKEYELDEYRDLFFEYFKDKNYNYYNAHKQVFGFNSTPYSILTDIDSFIEFIDNKIN